MVCELYLNKAIIRTKSNLQNSVQHILCKNMKQTLWNACAYVLIHMYKKHLWKETQEIIVAAPGEGNWVARRKNFFTLVPDEFF